MAPGAGPVLGRVLPGLWVMGAWHSAASPVQRPYDIHSGNAVESLVQLFSTMSVQYIPSWSKGMVTLLRKVSPQPCPEARASGGPGWGRSP